MRVAKIIWSVDPFESRGAILKNTLCFLTQLSAKTRLPVEPVYVVSPLELGITLEFSVPEKERFQSLALKQMLRFLKRVQIPQLLPPKILIERDPSITESVKTFTKYAAQEKGNLVVVGTHAKKGMQRFFLGSYAETVLFSPKVQVILVNPRTRCDSPLKKILFATDFSKKSKEAFDELCGLAAQLHSKLIIYHALPKPLGLWSVDTKASISEEVRQKEGEAREFVEKAKSNGIPATVMIEKTSSEKYEAILTQSKKLKVGIVALAAESGKMATTFLGSTTRKVVRGTTLPVWVYRSK